METSYSYTGKEFPKTNFFFEIDDGKHKLREPFLYLKEHGTVKDENWKRKFSRSEERKHGEQPSQRYEIIVDFLKKEGFVAEGEKKYRIKREGVGAIWGATKGDLGCPTELLRILENLSAMHKKNNGNIPLSYFEPVNHFKLLTEVESDFEFFKGKSDVFNSYLEKLSKLGFVDIITPSSKEALNAWLDWFKGYANIESKSI